MRGLQPLAPGCRIRASLVNTTVLVPLLPLPGRQPFGEVGTCCGRLREYPNPLFPAVQNTQLRGGGGCLCTFAARAAVWMTLLYGSSVPRQRATRPWACGPSPSLNLRGKAKTKWCLGMSWKGSRILTYQNNLGVSSRPDLHPI